MWYKVIVVVKKYKYKYILELIYEAKGQKYTKKKILDEPFE